MAEKIFTEEFCEIQKKSVCTTSEDLNFDNFIECGTYHIYEDKGDGSNCTYYLFVDKSESGRTTQTRVHCGKIEYRKQKADGKWTAWESSTGGGGEVVIPDNVCLWGGSVSSAEEFPENPKAGTICEITETFTNEGIIYGGRACDLFELTDGTGFLNDDEVDGTLYVLYFKGEKPSNTLFFNTADTVEEMFIRAYSVYGVCVGDIHASMPVGFPALLPLRYLGATEGTDPVTFYVGINQYTNSDNQFDNIPSGEFINVYNAGELAVWTGTRWANIPPALYTAAVLTTSDIMSREIAEMKSNIGNIGSALDELHAYAQALVNGGATS